MSEARERSRRPLWVGLLAALWVAAVTTGPVAAQQAEAEGAAGEPEGLVQQLQACGGIADDAERLGCFDALADAWLAEPDAGTMTVAELIATACGSDPACQRHGMEYRQISPDADVLAILVSACAKVRGAGRVDCFRSGLENYAKLGNADILRGNDTGRTAERLRTLSREALEDCPPQDSACLQEAIAVLAGELPP